MMRTAKNIRRQWHWIVPAALALVCLCGEIWSPAVQCGENNSNFGAATWDEVPKIRFGGHSDKECLRAVGHDWLAEWNLLIYAAHDAWWEDLLVGAFDQDMLELQYGTGGSSLFRIFVQRDYAKNQKIQGKNVADLNTTRFALYREQRFNPENPEEELWDLGRETDTSDERELSEFLAYGIEAFPAHRHWLVLSGYGNGWGGLALDFTPGVRWLPLKGLRHALEKANLVLKKTLERYPIGNRGIWSPDIASIKNPVIDIVQFDMCYMAAIESAAELAIGEPRAMYMLASQGVVPKPGFHYPALRFVAHNYLEKDTESIIQEVVGYYLISYIEGVSTTDRSYVPKTVSLVALDLRYLHNLLNPIREFVCAVLSEEDRKPYEYLKIDDSQEIGNGGFSYQEVIAIQKDVRDRELLYAIGKQGKLNSNRAIGGGRDTGVQNGCISTHGLRQAIAADGRYEQGEAGGSDESHFSDPAEAYGFVEQRMITATFVDLVALFEAFADPGAAHGVVLSNNIRQKAQAVLDAIGRPKSILSKYGGRLRIVRDFKPESIAKYSKSPFIIHAYAVPPSIERARTPRGLSILWGETMNLWKKHGVYLPKGAYEQEYLGKRSLLVTYRMLEFDKFTGWSEVMGKAIHQIAAHNEWDGKGEDPLLR